MKYTYSNLKPSVFPGFYYSSISQDEICMDSAPDGFYFDFTAESYKKYMLQTCKEWVGQMKNQLEHDNPLSVLIGDFDSVWSPREYNFSTDKISFSVKFNLNKLKEYCWKKNAYDFDKYLHDNWSDRPGFWSFVANNLSRFQDEYYHGTSYGAEKRDDYINVMLEYYFLNHINFDSVESFVFDSEYERVSENIYLKSLSNHSYWEYEWDNDKEIYKPTQKIA